MFIFLKPKKKKKEISDAIAMNHAIDICHNIQVATGRLICLVFNIQYYNVRTFSTSLAISGLELLRERKRGRKFKDPDTDDYMSNQ